MNARKQSSTTYPVQFFMTDSADHITGKTGLTVTATISKNGAAFAAVAGAVTEVGNGWYALAGNATDRNTLGEWLLHATATGADSAERQVEIVPYDPFDANLGLTALGTMGSPGVSGGLPTLNSGLNVAADVQTIKTQAVTCAAAVTVNANVGGAQPTNFTGTGTSALVKVDAIDWGGAAVGGMPNATTPPTAAAVATAVWTDLLASTDFSTASSIGKLLKDDVNAQLSTLMLASSYSAPPAASTVAAAVRDVDNTSPAAGSLGAKVNTSASAGDPWAASIPGSYATGTAGKILDAINTAAAKLSFDGSNYIYTHLKVYDSGLAPPTAAAVATAVLTDVTSGDLATSGSLGYLVGHAPSWYSAPPTPPSAATIASAVRDVDNTTPATGSLGAKVNAAAAGSDPWSVAIPGSYGAGTAGAILGSIGTASSKLTFDGSNRLETHLMAYDAALSAPPWYTAPTVPTAVQVAAAVWQDATPGDFTGTGSAGERLMALMLASSYAAAPSAATVAAAVRDVDNTAPATGSLGAAVNAAGGGGSAADPWLADVRTGYLSTQAGGMLDQLWNRIDDSISNVPGNLMDFAIEPGVATLQAIRAMAAAAGGQVSRVGSTNQFQVYGLGNAAGPVRLTATTDANYLTRFGVVLNL